MVGTVPVQFQVAGWLEVGGPGSNAMVQIEIPGNTVLFFPGGGLPVHVPVPVPIPVCFNRSMMYVGFIVSSGERGGPVFCSSSSGEHNACIGLAVCQNWHQKSWHVPIPWVTPTHLVDSLKQMNMPMP